MLDNFLNPSDPMPPSKETAVQTDDDGKRHAQKGCFATFNVLKHRFEKDGISESAFWSWGLWFSKKEPFGSRKQLDALNWSILTARLTAAQNDDACFQNLCSEIRHAGQCQVVRVDTEKGVYSGLVDKQILSRAQKYADNNKCVVKLTAYDREETFFPKSEVDPITSCRFDETEDGHPLMFVKFAGNEKEYTYDKLTLSQNTHCMLLWHARDAHGLKNYLDQIRLHYESYLAGQMTETEFEETQP